MAYEIIWTKYASNDLEKIINFLSDNWSYKIAREFIIECDIKIELISVTPFLGTISKKDSSVRRILVTKHNYLYYELIEDQIVLLNFFDTRQDPAKNPFN